MRIKAVRLAEVGPFAEGVAVEGLSGGFDVLTGPNEAGKSTVFRALAALIGEKHTSVAQAVQRLKSDRGGAPLIEADLEIDGRLWRLTKRFLTQRAAELADLSGGGLWRGAEAEQQLQVLFADSGRDALRAMVWVPQMASFTLPKGDDDLLAALSGLIEQEAADAAGAGLVRRVRAGVQVRLGELVTATGRPRKGGLLEQAMARRNEFAAALERAEDKAMHAAERAERLARLRSENAALAAPEVVAGLRGRLEAADKKLSDAGLARSRLATVDERQKARGLEHERAMAALTAFDKRSAEIDRLRVAGAQLAGDQKRLESERAAAEQHREGLRSERERVAVWIEDNRRRLAGQRAAQRRAVASGEARQLEQRSARATEAQDLIGRLGARLAADLIDVRKVEDARGLTARLGTVMARLEAAAARITIAYEAGADGRILIGGEAAKAGLAQLIDSPTEIVIEGVGRITIEPSASAGSGVAAERDSLIREIADICAAMGVADVAAADRGLEQRRALEQELAAVRARLAAEAPEGLPALAAAHGRAAQAADALDALNRHDDEVAVGAEVGAGSAVAANALAALEAREQTLRLELARLDEALAAADGAARQCGEALAGVVAERVASEKQYAAFVVENQAGRDDEGQVAASAGRAALAAAAALSVEGLAQAIRERDAWAAATPDAVAYAALEEDVNLARREARAHELRLGELGREMAELEGALNRDDAEGAGAEVAHLVERLSEAEARVGDLDVEVSALTLLAARMDADGSEHRERVLRPLVDRLQPLLSTLLPGASVALEGPLLLTRLEREGRTDAVARLSEGTREQVATLVRMAYARLMADRGAPLPLVLDDALVYSDDARMAAMFKLLADAARHHQVLVLSCREQVFDALADQAGACRLAITGWNHAKAFAGAPGAHVNRRGSARSAAG